MKKILVGLIIGLLFGSICYGYRISKPARIVDFDQNGLITINSNFEKLWDITNGRYNINIVTINPDGNSNGEVGDIVLYYNGVNYYLEINVSGSKIWRGIVLTDTP